MGIVDRDNFVLVARVSNEHDKKKMSFINFEKDTKEYFSRNIKFNNEFEGFER